MERLIDYYPRGQRTRRREQSQRKGTLPYHARMRLIKRPGLNRWRAGSLAKRRAYLPVPQSFLAGVRRAWGNWSVRFLWTHK